MRLSVFIHRLWEKLTPFAFIVNEFTRYFWLNASSPPFYAASWTWFSNNLQSKTDYFFIMIKTRKTVYSDDIESYFCWALLVARLQKLNVILFIWSFPVFTEFWIRRNYYLICFLSMFCLKKTPSYLFSVQLSDEKGMSSRVKYSYWCP